MGLNNAQPDGTRQYLGHGLVFAAIIDAAGVRAGEKFLGNSGGFKVSVSEETRKKYATTGPDSALLASAVLRRDVELGLILEEQAQRNLALALSGTEVTVSQTQPADPYRVNVEVGVFPAAGALPRIWRTSALCTR